MTLVVKYDNIVVPCCIAANDPEIHDPFHGIRAALKEFETFPEGARSICLAALTIAAEGGKADTAKPMYGMDPGSSKLLCRSGVMRSVWSMPVQLGEEVWVVHAFQKKLAQGTKTPKREVDLIRDRLKRL